MGRIGKCCCVCECLQLGELPNISISNMTGGAWIQSECCWTKTFTFNTTPATTTVCAPIHSKSDFSVSCEADIYAMRGPTPPLFLDDCQDFPLPLEYCCDSSPTLIGSRESQCHGTWQQRMRVSYRPKNIVVKVSRQNYSCDGQQTCKLVIFATYNYQYNFIEMTESDFDSSYSVEDNASEPCFQQGDSLTALPCSESLRGLSASFDCTTALDTDLFGFGFTRVKTYDSWPTGAVTFNNSDLMPENCDAPICKDDDFITQFCIQITGDECKFNCANGTLTTETITPINRCNGPFNQYAFTCTEDLPVIVACGKNDEDTRSCGSVTRGKIVFQSGDYPNCDDENTCDNLNILFNASSELPYLFYNTNFGLADTGFYSPVILPCIESNPASPASCAWGDDPCGGSYARDGFPFFTQWFDDITSYSYSGTCVNTTQSVCINAPSWTITFA